MTRLNPVNRQTADATTTQLLDGVEKKLGILPNMIATMAQSNAAANAYLGLSSTLGKGQLSAAVQEQIALAVGQRNGCDYCVAAHTMIGAGAGLDQQNIVDARMAQAQDPKTDAILKFASKVVESRGQVADEDVAGLINQGVSQGEIAEVVAHVALNTFTNYFNHIAATEIDFPVAPELPTASSCVTCS